MANDTTPQLQNFHWGVLGNRTPTLDKAESQDQLVSVSTLMELNTGCIRVLNNWYDCKYPCGHFPEGVWLTNVCKMPKLMPTISILVKCTSTGNIYCRLPGLSVKNDWQTEKPDTNCTDTNCICSPDTICVRGTAYSLPNLVWWL